MDLNLNKNKIEKIPWIKRECFPYLKTLKLEENLLSCYDDIFITDFACLQTLFISQNPISSKAKDLERTRKNCDKRSINLITDGSFPAKMTATKFFTEHNILNVNKMRKKSPPKPIEVEKDQDETQDSSFFITAVPRLNLKNIQKDHGAQEKIITPKSPFRSPTTKLFQPQTHSDIKQIAESYDRLNDLGKKINVTYDVKDSRKSTRQPLDRYEYNKDWFDLDVALNNIDSSVDEEIKSRIEVSQEKQKMALYNESIDLYKTNLSDKKNTYKALKFALDNPITIPVNDNPYAQSVKPKSNSFTSDSLKNLYN